jgi:hypothetical protein
LKTSKIDYCGFSKVAGAALPTFQKRTVHQKNIWQIYKPVILAPAGLQNLSVQL